MVTDFGGNRLGKNSQTGRPLLSDLHDELESCCVPGSHWEARNGLSIRESCLAGGSDLDLASLRLLKPPGWQSGSRGPETALDDDREQQWEGQEEGRCL